MPTMDEIFAEQAEQARRRTKWYPITNVPREPVVRPASATTRPTKGISFLVRPDPDGALDVCRIEWDDGDDWQIWEATFGTEPEAEEYIRFRRAEIEKARQAEGEGEHDEG